MATVLIVDDEEPILSIVAEVVEEMGHQVLRAMNGRDALALIRSTPPDLVLSDVMMPLMNGLDLCRAVKSDRATEQITIILMSAVPAGRSHGVGADGFVNKPFSLVEIEEAVVSGLSGKRSGGTA